MRWLHWQVWHITTHWKGTRGCLGCMIIREELWRKAEGLWLVYIVLAWLLLNAGIVLGR